MRPPTVDLSADDLLEADDDIATHMPTVRMARELKRHRATMKRLDEWATALLATGAPTSEHFAHLLRGKMVGE